MMHQPANDNPKPSAEEQAAWDGYVAAMRLAQTSLRLADGIAAGKAWARFIKLYGGEQ